MLGAPLLPAQVSTQSATAVPTTEPPKKLEPFEVTGSRIKRTDVEGPSPVHIVTREDIDLVGATGLTDILRELPEATNLGINEGAVTTTVRGGTALDLRSLGPGNTLLLVDGRRQAPNGIHSGGTVFVDPNRFPTAMIERVEVLKDGASAVYGADATAGVVNIITRKNFNGAEISMRYGNYLKTDGAEQAWSFLGGIARGRARLTVALTSTSRQANAAIDQPFSANGDLTERYRALDANKYAGLLQPTPTANSAFDNRSTVGPYATVGVPSAAQLTAAGLTTAAIRNPLTGTTATFLPGTGGIAQGTLGAAASFASVPRGNNPAQPTAAQFVPRAYLPGDSSNSFNGSPFVWNVPEMRRRGLTTRFAFDLTPFAQLFASVSYQRNESTTHLPPSPITTANDNILVPANNYYNPFGIPVAFTYRPLESGARIADTVGTSVDFLLGAKGTWRQRFEWDVAISTSYNETRDTSPGSLSRAGLRAALAKTTPDALNIFGGPTFKNDPATLAGIRIAPFISGDARTTVADAHGGTAELFSLPWGKVGGSAGFEHRAENFNVTNDPLSTVLVDVVGQIGRANDPTRAQRNVASFAAELRVPLLREGRFRFAHTLELSSAARFEKFSDGYDSGIKPFGGLRFRLTRHLLLRASAGKVFRAPSLPQLYGGVVDRELSGQPDLRRPTALTGDPIDSSTFLRPVRSGGNPKLLPEDGRTKQLGAVFDFPGKTLQGLSLDFTHGVIEQTNLITPGLGTNFIRQNELTSTADLVIREPGTATFTNSTSAPIGVLSGPGGLTTPVQPGQAATVPGRILYLLDGAINLADQIVRYYDYGLRYDVRTERLGRFTATSNWTYYGYYAARRFTTSPYETSVGRNLPRYRAQSSITWQRGAWGGNLGMNYIHRQRDLTRDQYEVQRYSTFSAGVSYHFRRDPFLGDLRIALGVENLLDRDPPLAPTVTGYNQSLVGRPGGRFAFLTLRRSL
jgi:outer membrane receptor protein involved in Fe transport